MREIRITTIGVVPAQAPLGLWKGAEQWGMGGTAARLAAESAEQPLCGGLWSELFGAE